MPIRLLSVFVLCLLGACSNEKPDQVFVQSEEVAADRDQAAMVDERRQRTMRQGEAGRIYGGALR